MEKHRVAAWPRPITPKGLISPHGKVISGPEEDQIIQ